MKIEDLEFMILRCLMPGIFATIGILTVLDLTEFRPDYEFTEENFRMVYSTLCFSAAITMYYLFKDLIRKKDKSELNDVPQKEE